jgi:pyruvate dehydrogenase E1 component alpha subunit
VAVELKQTFDMIQILNEEGELNPGQEVPELSDEELKDLYRWMLRLRIFDQRAVKLNRQGRLGFYAPMAGQEACQIGSVAALRREDWLFPSYRDMGASMYHGLPLHQVFLYSRGQIGGGRIPEGVNMFPPQIIIAAQVLHAAGAGWGFQLRGEEKVAMAMFGDGATSQGDFHEGLNFASVMNARTIFFCQNNQYAISVPISKQMKSKTIAQKAIAYEIPGVRVDGNDILAVYREVKAAGERARRGEGPTLIEAVTYRLGTHTMAGDDPSRYREKREEEEWKEKRDPLKRFRRFLEKKGLWSDQEEERTEQEMLEEINEGIKKVEAMPKGAVVDVFEDVYTEMTPDLKAQKEEFLKWKGETK